MKIFHFIVFSLTLTPVLSQDYPDYYLKCNRSDSLSHVGDTQGALDEIKLAIGLVT